MADTLPLNFPVENELLNLNIDYFDYAASAGYKKFYFGGTKDSVGDDYVLTTDSSLVSDTKNYTIDNGEDVDFDIKFKNPVTIANADAIVSFMAFCSGVDGDSFSATITVYHYDGSTETSLGTVTVTDSDADPSRYIKHTANFALTRKRFKVGDILRVSIAVTCSASWKMYIDPAGTISQTAESSGTITSTGSINIPFEVNL